jgi:hypothetical protein
LIDRFAAWVLGAWLLCSSAGWAELLVLESEGGAVLISTQEVKEEGGKVFFKENSGTQREVAKKKVLKKIPSLPTAEQELSREVAVGAINELLEAKSLYPNLQEALQKEVEGWKERLDKMPSPQDPEALAQAESAFVAATEKAMPSGHDFRRSYTLEELDGQLAALNALKKEFPDRAEEVEKLAGPWQLEEEQQRAGKKKFEGRWLDPVEWEKEKGARQEVAKAAFLEKIQSPALPPLLFGQAFFFAGLGLLAGGGLLGFSFLFHGVVEMLKHRAWWKGSAWALAGMVLFALVSRAAVLAVTTPERLAGPDQVDAAQLEEMLWQQAGLGQSMPEQVRLTDSEINAWWSRRLRFAPLGVADVLAASTEGWRIQFLEGGLTLDRTGRWLGQNLLLRHRLFFSRSEKGEDVYRVEASLGKLPLPPALVLRTWNQWVESIVQQATLFPGAKEARLERLEKGAVVFSAK